MKLANREITMRKIVTFAGVLSWLMTAAFLPQPARQIPADASPQTARSVTASVNPSEYEAFFDREIPLQLAQYHIPGAAVALVKDGSLVFSEGYGFADVSNGKKVDASATIFRTGSVAKLFVWTAVLQLAEQGELDLDTDINQYLPDFQIPAAFPQPITLKHLMTHTAGFEDGPIGMQRADTADLEPLGDFLARRVPARIYRPGEVSAYSNYGCALAAYIVEIVTQQRFETYVEENILLPLGMKDTTFQQPVPPEMKSLLAIGYGYANGEFIEKPFEVYEIAPAGGASGTVNDMAKFMLAHLAEGKLNGARILQAETIQEMHRVQFRNDPRLTGVAYGFYQTRINNRLLLTHAGDTSFFHTQVFLLPEENLGLYVAYNAAGGIPARKSLAQNFFDQFFPAVSKTDIESARIIPEELKRLTGSYASTRGVESTLEKTRRLFDPFVQPIRVVRLNDASIEVIQPLEQSLSPGTYQPGQWEALQSNVFLKSDGKDTLVFHTRPSGEVWMYQDSNPLRGFRKLSWYEEILYQIWFPAGSVLLLTAMMVFALINKKADKMVRVMTVAAGLSALLFFAGLAGFGLMAFLDYLYGQIASLWYVVFALPVLLGIICLALPWRVWKAGWKNHQPYGVVVAATAALLVWMNYWNLIGWRF